MIQGDYDRITADLMALAREIETSKRPGYTVGADDVLANFKAVATRLGITTEQAWGVYFLKHIDAMVAIMTRPDLPVSEAPPGRFADGINYIRLGYAILHEREAQKPLQKPAGKDTRRDEQIREQVEALLGQCLQCANPNLKGIHSCRREVPEFVEAGPNAWVKRR